MYSILIVDDEKDLEFLIKQKFRKEIRENIYRFEFALNGLEALEKLAIDSDINVILSDINMPEMDGLTLLSKLQEAHPLTKTVIISAYGDMDNIRTAMNRGAFDFICKPVNFEDLKLTIQKTINHVNQLKQTMRAIKENNILKMYVDQSVLLFMESKEYEKSLHTSEQLEATVAFIDICGFTAISETESPEMVVNLLNTYFDVMVKEIIQQDGMIDKFIGDAIMAVFKGPYHLDRAIDSAIGIRESLNKLPKVEGGSAYKPNVSIGINSGEMVSGNIGSKTLKRLDYTVIGDTVNIAARLQSLADPGQILVSENCYNLVKESFQFNKIGEQKLKNKAEQLMVYEVLA
jgi:adenylate cyclase